MHTPPFVPPLRCIKYTPHRIHTHTQSIFQRLFETHQSRRRHRRRRQRRRRRSFRTLPKCLRVPGSGRTQNPFRAHTDIYADVLVSTSAHTPHKGSLSHKQTHTHTHGRTKKTLTRKLLARDNFVQRACARGGRTVPADRLYTPPSAAARCRAVGQASCRTACSVRHATLLQLLVLLSLAP